MIQQENVWVFCIPLCIYVMVSVELKTNYMAKRKDKENLVVELQNNDTKQTLKKSGNLTIATALTQVIEQAKNSHLSEEFRKTCEASR